jgi:hypothetical protein
LPDEEESFAFSSLAFSPGHEQSASAAATNSLAVVRLKWFQLLASRCAWFVRRLIVPLPSEIGFIQTKSRNRPTRGDAVLFVLSIRPEKGLSPAKNLTVGGVHLVQSPAPNGHDVNIQMVTFPKRAILSLSWMR